MKMKPIKDCWKDLVQNIKMKKLIKSLTKKEICLLLLAMPFNYLIYYGARFLVRNNYHYSLPTLFEDKIPFMPWTVIFYWGLSIIWIINYYIGVRDGKEDNYRFIKAHYIGDIIAFIVFIFFPTVMKRPEVIGNDLLSNIVKMQYTVDEPNNLLPSIHCFVSWLCFRGIVKNDKIPTWYKWVSFISAILICVSTLTVKQHLFVDTIAGILLAEISYLIAKYIDNKANCSKNIDE